MAVNVARLTIGAPGLLTSGFARWTLAPGIKVPAVLMASGVAQDLERLEFFASRRQVSMRTGGATGAGDLTAAWETNNPALILRAGSVSLRLPGPDSTGAGSRDPNEPYTWTLPDGDTSLTTFLAAYRALSGTARNGTVLTLADGIIPDVLGPFSAKAGTPDGGTFRGTVTDEPRETLGPFSGKAGTPKVGTFLGTVTDEPIDVLGPFSAKAGTPDGGTFRMRTEIRFRETLGPFSAKAGTPVGGTFRGTVTDEPQDVLGPFSAKAGTPVGGTFRGMVTDEPVDVLGPFSAKAGTPDGGTFRGRTDPLPSEDREIIGTADGRPFLVDWARPVDEAYQFRTEIIRSYRGREQRIAQRTVPRITHTYEGWLDRSGMRQLARTLEIRQGVLDLHIPHARDSAALSTAVAAGGSGAPFAEAPPWAGDTEQLFVSDGERSEVVRAGAYSGGEMATSEFRYGHSAGTRLYRMVRGYFTDGTRIAAQARHAGRVRVELQEDVRDAWHDPVFEIRPDENPEIDGLEYLGLGPNWSRPVQIEYLQARQELDFTRGPVDRIYPEGPHTDRTQRSEFLIRNETHLNQVLGLFYRCRGAQMPFYMDSLLDTLTVVEDIGAGEDRVLFRGTELAEDYDDLTAYRRFRVRGAGLDQVQEVQSVTAIGGNSLVVTADPFRASAAAKDIGYAAWVVRSRFETDLLTLRWETSRVARAQVTTRLLEDA